MPSFTKGALAKTPFGVNRYLKSTRDTAYTGYTVAMNSIPYETIDGSQQRLLQPGTVMAKITSGPDAGKIGPFQAVGTAAVQTITPTGTWSGGTFTLTFNGQTTGALAFNASNAAIQTALNGLSNVGAVGGSITVTGGPINTAATTYTFGGSLTGPQPVLTINTTAVTGTTPAATVANTTPGVAGSIDGRGVVDNIVGINDTFLPWQLLDRDVEVAVLYDGNVVQAWCFELSAAGARVALTNATALAKGTGAVATDTYVFRGKGIDILFS